MIKTCLFPVAGFGTRFMPATKSIPKELFPIMNKPLIHHAVLEASNAGLENMCFITNKQPCKSSLLLQECPVFEGRKKISQNKFEFVGA